MNTLTKLQEKYMAKFQVVWSAYFLKGNPARPAIFTIVEELVKKSFEAGKGERKENIPKEKPNYKCNTCKDYHGKDLLKCSGCGYELKILNK